MHYYSVMTSNNETLKHQLLSHRIVQRLLNNPNWEPAARAAVDHFVDHKQCPVPSWVKSSTWAQVKMAYEEITRR
jgi:hypothetical protein